MPGTMRTARRHEVSRLEAFSDAVFAFALTLLVVSLEVPSSYADLMRLMTGFVPFAASFALLTWIWYEHTAFFRAYGLQDPLTAAINAMLLFVVLFYVYPLKFLFTAAFSFFIPVVDATLAVTPPELARIFAIYGAGSSRSSPRSPCCTCRRIAGARTWVSPRWRCWNCGWPAADTGSAWRSARSPSSSRASRPTWRSFPASRTSSWDRRTGCMAFAPDAGGRRSRRASAATRR